MIIMHMLFNTACAAFTCAFLYTLAFYARVLLYVTQACNASVCRRPFMVLYVLFVHVIFVYHTGFYCKCFPSSVYSTTRAFNTSVSCRPFTMLHVLLTQVFFVVHASCILRFFTIGFFRAIIWTMIPFLVRPTWMLYLTSKF